MRFFVMFYASSLVEIACHRNSRSELWLIPNNYVGWLRLDYSVPGSPALPTKDGRFVVRMPATGRMQTSSPGSTRIDKNEYGSEGAAGWRKLPVSSAKAIQGYGIQSVFGFTARSNSRFPEVEFECVFVGTRSAFKSQRQDCRAWELGRPIPPDYPYPATSPR